MQNGVWTCPDCTLTNSRHVALCGVCGNPQPGMNDEEYTKMTAQQLDWTRLSPATREKIAEFSGSWSRNVPYPAATLKGSSGGSSSSSSSSSSSFSSNAPVAPDVVARGEVGMALEDDEGQEEDERLRRFVAMQELFEQMKKEHRENAPELRQLVDDLTLTSTFQSVILSDHDERAPSATSSTTTSSTSSASSSSSYAPQFLFSQSLLPQHPEP
jgi:hypothetical protein